MLKRAAAYVVGAMLLVSMPAITAAATITNGGFETGTFAGWTQTGDTSFSGVLGGSTAHSGLWGAFFGPTAVGGITQSVATTANTDYEVSFWLTLIDSGVPNAFSWRWNGVLQQPAFVNASAFAYTSFSAVVHATGTTSTLAFNFTDPQAFWYLDDVVIGQAPPPGRGNVPEPGSLALVALAMVVLQAARRHGRATSL